MAIKVKIQLVGKKMVFSGKKRRIKGQRKKNIDKKERHEKKCRNGLVVKQKLSTV